MENNSRTKLVLFCLSLLILACVFVSSFQESKHLDKMTALSSLKDRNVLSVFVANYIFQKIKKQFEVKPSKLTGILNDFIDQPDSSFDLFYLPKRSNYCQANFLFQFFTLDTKDSFLFMDYANTDPLKKQLNIDFDFLNSLVFAQKDYSKKEIDRLQNMEWSPKIKLLFTRTNLNYNNFIGKTGVCLHQMSSQIPGSSLLHRTDLLIDRLHSMIEGSELDDHSSLLRASLPRTFRLYDSSECNEWFHIIKSKRFKDLMRKQIVFTLKRAEHTRDFSLDYLGIHKLSKIYNKGSLCGRLKQRNIIQEYSNNQIRFKNGRKFVIRTYLVVLSANPLLVGFNKGVVILDRFNNFVPFSKAVTDRRKVFDFLHESKTISESEEEQLYARMKEVVTGLHRLVQNDYLKDHRFFQVFSVDFILTSKKELLLHNWNGAPLLTSLDYPFLNEVLKTEMKLLNLKIKESKNLLSHHHAKMMDVFYRKGSEFEFVEDFLVELEENYQSQKMVKDFAQTLRNPVESLDLSGLETIEIIPTTDKESNNQNEGNSKSG